MSDDRRLDEYLWDPKNAPDPEVERLERLLSRYRWQERSAPAVARGWRWRIAIPAAALVAASVLVFLFASRGPFYRVSGVEGLARARPGDWIEAGADAARVEIAGIGDVELRPGSRLRVDDIELGGDEGEGARHELYLAGGTLHARIVAGPRVFQVDTPAGISIDLGCEYELEVDAEDRAKISVFTGQIAFGWGGREVYVPAGASCESIPGSGPTPPMFDTITSERRELVLRLARGEPWTQADLGRLTELDSREDALPLFAMLGDTRIDSRIREAIHPRLESAFGRPKDATLQAILSGDEEQLRAWLDLAKDWWRSAKIGGAAESGD